MKTYYLYRHLRKDKNEIFYIGIGTKPFNSRTSKKTYSRAFSKLKRNPHWLNIVENSEYEVEILFETPIFDLILKKETEFINLYGRSDLKLGTLSNLNNGGTGNKEMIFSLESKAKQSISAKLSYIKGRKSKSIKVFAYMVSGEYVGEYKSCSDCAKELNLNFQDVCSVISGKLKTTHGYIFKKTFLGNTIEKIRPNKNKGIQIEVISIKGNKTYLFPSFAKAARDLKGNREIIRKRCYSETKSPYKGFLFKII